ncbi:sensor histidine kinase [Ramlibacter alkalitolerans]|uniref:Sensor histidine kinase n=1 Tax=Ramlibacter alkalitolerans TaxID=2039631 RepID=A0ABS1JRA1_9BURK|nr:sensor histidine kinase [Ramlibacter alkalitolerans]MBL0426799.1 sensor histidine kinase [Ramlibacter alkalitolerans]
MPLRSPLTLSRQFLVASFPIVLLGMLALGWYVGTAIERGVSNRIAGVTSLYVDSFIAPHLQHLQPGGDLRPEDRAALDRLMTETPLGRKIVAFKIWDARGRIVYSTNPALIGRQYPIDEGLASAFQGRVQSGLSELDESENELERTRWKRLLETYSPVHAAGRGTVLAVAEFYQTTDEMAQEVRTAQIGSWLVVGGIMLAMYLLLFGVVRRGSETIDSQREQLRAKVAELSGVLKRNQELSDHIRLTAVRTTTLNDQFLRQIAADLHDGAAQDLALGLMQFESLARKCEAHGNGEEAALVRAALQSAMRELRATCVGLQLPEIDRLDAFGVVQRAAQDFERKTGSHITVSNGGGGGSGQPAGPVKTTMYRLIQEALGNGLRHGGASALKVDLSCDADSVLVEVGDNGCGFDTAGAAPPGHLGLAGMRERVELLRGSMVVRSTPGRGTLVQARLPMTIEGYAE